jgi:hypothetical protein
MKKHHLFMWILSAFLLLLVSTPALAVKVSVKFGSSDLGDFSFYNMGIINQTCDNFTSVGINSIDIPAGAASTVCILIVLRARDGWEVSSASTVQVNSSCDVPGLTNYTFIAGNDLQIYMSYPTVSKDTTIMLNLQSNSNAVKDQGDFTLAVGCTHP